MKSFVICALFHWGRRRKGRKHQERHTCIFFFIHSAQLPETASPMQCSQRLRWVLLHPSIQSKSILVKGTSSLIKFTWASIGGSHHACNLILFAWHQGLWGSPTILINAINSSFWSFKLRKLAQKDLLAVVFVTAVVKAVFYRSRSTLHTQRVTGWNNCISLHKT